MEIDFYNPRSVILFFCILQGTIFSLLLIWRSRQNKSWADLWLGLLLVFLCLSLITPFIGFANIYDRNQWLTFFPFGNAYVDGTLIYFYVLSLTESKRKFTRRDLLLVIPAIIYLVFRLILFCQNLEFKDWFNENYYVPVASPTIFVTGFFWNTSLLYFSIKHYRKYRRWLNENFSDTEQVKFDWLQNFLYIFTFVFIVGGIFDFTDSFIFHLSYIQYFYFELVLAFVTYYLAIAGYMRSQTIELNFTKVESENIERVTEERKALLSESELENLKAKLQKLMKTKKLFLDSQLTLSNLAKHLGVNTTVLSYVINNGFKQNFNDFVNEFRVNEVKNRLNDGSSKNSNLLNIALDSGFNSKATFNRAFKKSTGFSPKDFQENSAAK